MNGSNLTKRKIEIEQRVGKHGGGGGFFLACENFGKMFNNEFPAGAFIIFFKKMCRLAHAY